jgi:hypothetical protein
MKGIPVKNLFWRPDVEFSEISLQQMYMPFQVNLPYTVKLLMFRLHPIEHIFYVLVFFIFLRDYSHRYEQVLIR